MPKTKTQRNKYAREWRKNSYEEKRFNKPLREFLELKYRDIFNEYNWFYKSLNEQCPTSKDLTKTTGYKNWKRRQLNCESSDDEPTETEPAETEQPETEQPETEQPETEPAKTEQPETEQPETESAETEQPETEQSETEPAETEQPETESNILTVALEETFPPDDNNYVDINNMDINQIDSIIEQVINELEGEEAIRELLNNNELVHPHYQDQDEGIGLDVESELEAILEPFDYELEVEGIDY